MEERIAALENDVQTLREVIGLMQLTDEVNQALIEVILKRLVDNEKTSSTASVHRNLTRKELSSAILGAEANIGLLRVMVRMQSNQISELSARILKLENPEDEE